MADEVEILQERIRKNQERLDRNSLTPTHKQTILEQVAEDTRRLRELQQESAK